MEHILSALIGELVSKGIIVSEKIIQTTLGKQDSSLETQIYQVLVDTLNYITNNRYKTNQEKIYKVAVLLLKSLEDDKKDEIESIKFCLKEICGDVDDGMCKKFQEMLYQEICKNENSELYRQISLKIQINTCKAIKSKTISNAQNDEKDYIADNDINDADKEKYIRPYVKKQNRQLLLKAFLFVLAIVIIGILLLFMSRNENNEVDINTEKKLEEIIMSENSYKNAIQNASGEEIIDSHYNDFDSDGKCEMFAIVGEAFDDKDGCIGKGKIWFVNQQGAYCVEDEERLYWNNVKKHLFGNNIFIVFEEYSISSGIAFLWSVIDGKPFEAGLTNKSNYFTINNYKEVVLTHSAYHGAVMIEKGEEHWLGHTYNDYYYYWNGRAFREYGAIQITPEELLQVEGTSELIDYINDLGADINEIYYRGNNIFHINYQIKEDDDNFVNINYYNLTFRYHGEEIQLEKCQINSGIIHKALNSSLAEYPDGFDIEALNTE